MVDNDNAEVCAKFEGILGDPPFLGDIFAFWAPRLKSFQKSRRAAHCAEFFFLKIIESFRYVVIFGTSIIAAQLSLLWEYF